MGPEVTGTCRAGGGRCGVEFDMLLNGAVFSGDDGSQEAQQARR